MKKLVLCSLLALGAGGVFAADAAPTAADVQTNLNVVWTLLGGILVFVMQAGFALVETGFTRAKNAANIMMKNLMDFAFGSIVFYFIGAALMFGKETKGLPEELLHDNPDSCVRIPMINNSGARSLNLSNSVAVGVYEVLRQWGYPELLTKGKLTKFDWDK